MLEGRGFDARENAREAKEKEMNGEEERREELSDDGRKGRCLWRWLKSGDL